jgi:hypothetical protein
MRATLVLALCAILLLAGTTAVGRCQAEVLAGSTPQSPATWWQYVTEEHIQPSVEWLGDWAGQIRQACQTVAQSIRTSAGRFHEMLPSVAAPWREILAMPPLLLLRGASSSSFFRTDWVSLPMPTLPLPRCTACHEWLTGLSDWLSSVDATLVETANCRTCRSVQATTTVQQPPDAPPKDVTVMRFRPSFRHRNASTAAPLTLPAALLLPVASSLAVPTAWKNDSCSKAGVDLWVDPSGLRWIETRKLVDRPTLTVLLAEFDHRPGSDTGDAPLRTAMVLLRNATWHWFLIDGIALEQTTPLLNPSSDVRATVMVSLWTQLSSAAAGSAPLSRLANFTVEPTGTVDAPVESESATESSTFKRVVLSLVAAWLTMSLVRDLRQRMQPRKSAQGSSGTGRLSRNLQIRKRRSAEALPPPPPPPPRNAKQQRSPARSAPHDGAAVRFPADLAANY